MEDIFRGTGIEIEIKHSDDFLKIAETLTRIGVASRNQPTLFQSCHILHKRDSSGKSRYSIVHFKEMFKLDGKPSSFEIKDESRRNIIVRLLREWNLLNIIDKDKLLLTEDVDKEIQTTVKVIPYREKSNWDLVAKYQIGRKPSE